MRTLRAAPDLRMPVKPKLLVITAKDGSVVRTRVLSSKAASTAAKIRKREWVKSVVIKDVKS